MMARLRNPADSNQTNIEKKPTFSPLELERVAFGCMKDGPGHASYELCWKALRDSGQPEFVQRLGKAEFGCIDAIPSSPVGEDRIEGQGGHPFFVC